MEAIIDSLKKAGKIFYPKTKTKAVYDDNNNRLDNTLTSINDSLNSLDTKTNNLIKTQKVTASLSSISANSSQDYTFTGTIPSGYKCISMTPHTTNTSGIIASVNYAYNLDTATCMAKFYNPLGYSATSVNIECVFVYIKNI